MSVYQHLLTTAEHKGAAYCVLVDPDKIDASTVPSFAQTAAESGADAILVGGSLMVDNSFDRTIESLKKHSTLPVVIFPGSLMQVSAKADAILFLSVISGRNPDYLIGAQVLASPIIKKVGLEAISTAYMLVESGRTTSAEFMSNTRPLPRHKPEIAVAHALAAEFLGFKFIYLEAGSGAEHPVPEEMIGAVAKHSSIPVIVGGGLTTPELAHRKVQAGAKFIVTGNLWEQGHDKKLMKAFADAIHRTSPNH